MQTPHPLPHLLHDGLALFEPRYVVTIECGDKCRKYGFNRLTKKDVLTATLLRASEMLGTSTVDPALVNTKFRLEGPGGSVSEMVYDPDNISLIEKK